MPLWLVGEFLIMQDTFVTYRVQRYEIQQQTHDN